MERCQEHMIADGEVERSRKMNGVVERIRLCRKCGSRFKTFELADDQLAKEQAEYDAGLNEVKMKLKYYKEVVENIKAWYEVERMLKVALKSEYEFGNEDRD